MLTIESQIFSVGPYNVQLRQEPNQRQALYWVFLGYVQIGKCVSRPSLSDAEWLHREQRNKTGYAYSSAPMQELSGKRRSANYLSPARNRKVGAPRKPETIRDIAKALAGG